MKDLFSYDFVLPMEKALDAAMLRQQVISENLSNVNNPNYTAKNVAFEEEMGEALGKYFKGEDQEEKNEGRAMLASLEPETTQTGNKVDMQQEMVNLAKNQILYNALAARIGGYLSGMKYVVDNSGR